MTKNYKEITHFYLKLLLGLWIMISQVDSRSRSDYEVAESIDWQKIKLEERYYDKISTALSNIVDKKHFLVKVEAVIGTVLPLKFEDDEKENDDSDNLNSDKNEEELPRDQYPTVKVSDIKFDDSKGDYIAFSKIGLEVPILEKYVGIEKESRKEKKVSEDIKEDVNKNNKNEDKKFLEYLYKYQKSFDLFENLKDLKIEVMLDEKLENEKVQIIRKVLKNLKLNIAGIEPEIIVKMIQLTLPKKVDPPPKEEELKFRELIDIVSKFSGAIAIILATFLLGLISYVLLRYYVKNSKNQQDTPAAAPFLGAEDDDSGSDKDSEGPRDDALPSLKDLEEVGVSGVERFRNFWSFNNVEAQVLLKKWIGSNDKKSKIGLTALSQQLDHEFLNKIFTKLSVKDREAWKNSIKDFLTPTELSTASLYLSEQIVSEMIVPPAISDPELVSQILSLSAEEGARFIEENQTYGRVLLNLINPLYSAQILAKIEPNMAEDVLASSIDFKFSDIENDLEGFKKSVSKYKSESESLPFLQKLQEILNNITPEREDIVFRTFGRSGDKIALMKALQSYFPGDLIIDLPEELLKAIFQVYPLQSKVELLLSVDSDKKMKMLSVCAPENSPARELLDLEFSNVESNEKVRQKIEKDKNEIWGEFVKHTRKMIKKDTQFTEEIDNILEKYGNSLIEQVGDLGSDLKAS
jgi:hypothetical protein